MNDSGRSPAIAAPGKLILMGEYAVLEGGPGVVASVDRYVTLRPAPDVKPAGDQRNLVGFTRSFAATAWGLPPPSIAWIADSGAFSRGGVKLGLGSSAAVTVCAAASVMFENGINVEDPESRTRILEFAKAAQDAFQGYSGSGLDVAASVYGGYLVFRRSIGRSSPPAVEPWAPPPGLDFRFAWTGRAASSPDLVTRVGKFKKACPGRYRTIIDRMSKTAAAFATEGSDAAEALSAIEDYASLMDELGRESGAPIVDPLMERAFDAARRSGGAAKPSGAGGGDFVVAAFPPGSNPAVFEKRARLLGMIPMTFHPSSCGVTEGR